MRDTRETDNMAKGEPTVPTWWAEHLERQRNAAKEELTFLKRENNNILLALGSIQAAIGEALGLDYTPQTAEQVKQEIEAKING